MALTIAQLLKGTFARQVATLAGGTALAQIVNLLSLPVLTRLYTPSDFGIHAFFLAVVAIGSVVASLKYEDAIVASKTDVEAKLCVALVFWLSTLVAVAGLILVLVVDLAFPLGQDNLVLLASCAALMLMFYAWSQSLYYLGNRLSHYAYMTKGRVFASAGFVLFGIGYGWISGGFAGLVIASVVGLFINMLYLLIRTKEVSIGWILSVRSQLWQIARANGRFPRYLVASGLLDQASSQLHIFFFTTYLSAAVAGAVSLHNRVVGLPSTVVGNAIGDVFKRRAAEELRQHNSCRRLFLRTAGTLAAIVAVPALVLVLFAPELFQLVFGEQWRTAGEFSRRLAVVFAIGFVVSPLSALLVLEENQKYDLVVQVLLMALLLAGFAWAYGQGDAMSAIYAYAAAYTIKYLLELYFCWCIATGRDWMLKDRPSIPPATDIAASGKAD